MTDFLSNIDVKRFRELITFLTIFDAFKYLVMLFGLYNKQASWQYFIYDTLFDFLYYFI